MTVISKQKSSNYSSRRLQTIKQCIFPTYNQLIAVREVKASFRLLFLQTVEITNNREEAHHNWHL